jgi:hypothetical protein
MGDFWPASKFFGNKAGTPVSRAVEVKNERQIS